MGTLTGSTPSIAEHCIHKLPTSCRLTATAKCCACQDRRSHSAFYQVYVDGVGLVNRGTRWQRYCWFCKEFWDNRMKTATPPIDPSQTRIPDEPDQTAFLNRWHDYHRGFRTEDQDGRAVEIAMAPEQPWLDTAPGMLPRLNSDGVDLFAARAVRRAPQIDTEHISIENTLDELLNAADEPDDPASSEHAVAVPDLSPEATRQRLEQTRQQIAAAVQRRNELSQQMQDIDQQLRDYRNVRNRLGSEGSSSRVARSQRRTAEAYARVFGSREDIARQGDEYVSPLASMFGRAYDRYRIAEEVRAEERAANVNTERYRQLMARLQYPSLRVPDVVNLDAGAGPVQTLEDESRPPPMSDEAMTIRLECRICLSQKADVALIPCGHLILCWYCVKVTIPSREDDPLQPQRRSSKCPLCQKQVRRLLRVLF